MTRKGRALQLGVLPVLVLCCGGAAAADETDVRAMSNGYALVYQTAQKVGRLPKLLYVKFESDPVDALATSLGRHAASARSDIEAYADSHPGIDLSDAGLPVIERERRSRTKNALVKNLVTSSGTDFERLFLLAMLNLMNQLRHASAALADMPQDQAGVDLASRWQARFQRDYESVGALLRKDYFAGSGSPGALRSSRPSEPFAGQATIGLIQLAARSW